VLGVAAARDERAHVIADAPVPDSVADLLDGAGDFESGNIRRSGRGRVFTLPLGDVGPIHTSGQHMDQHVTRRGSGDRAFHRRQHIGTAWLSDLNREHGTMRSVA
jgi:hypothetical protein